MTTITQTDLLEELQREAARRRASTSLLGYNLYTIPGYVPSRFHTYLCNTIDDFMSTTNSEGFDILLLSVPPQTGKSTTVTESLPAYWLGKHPEKKWMIASYNTDFASNFGRKNRQKAQTLNPEIFPGFSLIDSPCNNIEFYTPQGGGIYSAGILAGLTGHTADCFIIDDPIKTRQEAESSTTKEAI